MREAAPPTSAVKPEESAAPAQWKDYTKINAEFFEKQ